MKFVTVLAAAITVSAIATPVLAQEALGRWYDTGADAAAYLQPSLSDGQDGTGAIARGTALVSLTASF